MKKYIIFLLFIFILFFLTNSKETFLGKLSPVKRNMPIDPRCLPKTPKQKFLFHNSPHEYYVRTKCLKEV